MASKYARAQYHLRKARLHSRKVKDEELGEGLKRLSTGLLRMNGLLRAILVQTKK